MEVESNTQQQQQQQVVIDHVNNNNKRKRQSNKANNEGDRKKTNNNKHKRSATTKTVSKNKAADMTLEENQRMTIVSNFFDMLTTIKHPMWMHSDCTLSGTYIRMPMIHPSNPITTTFNTTNSVNVKTYDGNNYYRLRWFHRLVLHKASLPGNENKNENEALKRGLLRIGGEALFVTEKQCFQLFPNVSQEDVKLCLTNKPRTSVSNAFKKAGDPNGATRWDRQDHLVNYGRTPIFHLAYVVDELEKERPERFQHLRGGRSAKLDKYLIELREYRNKSDMLPVWIRRSEQLLRLDAQSDAQALALCRTDEDLRTMVGPPSKVPSLQSQCLRAIHRAGATGEIVLEKHLNNPNVYIPEEIRNAVWPHVEPSPVVIESIVKTFVPSVLTLEEAQRVLDDVKAVKNEYDNLSDYMNGITSELIAKAMTFDKWSFVEDERLSDEQIERLYALEENSKERKTLETKYEREKAERKALVALYLRARLADKHHFALIIWTREERRAIARYNDPKTKESTKRRMRQALLEQLYQAAGLEYPHRTKQGSETGPHIKFSLLGL